MAKKKKVVRKVAAKATKKTAKKSEKKKKRKYGADFHVTPSVTTEQALTAHLDDDLKEALTELRDFALALGPQRFYASHRSIMFAKSVCYAFVRPKKSYLEVVIFLKREMHELGFKSKAASKVKFYSTFKLIHRDQVEGVLTDAIREAYEGID